MPEYIDQFNYIVAAAVGLIVLMQLMVAAFTFAVLRSAAKERVQLNRELFGLVKRIEALTSQSREQMLQHYDRLLEDLTNKVPVIVASHAGEKLFEAESKILQRLAELEPDLRSDLSAKRKMDELIKSMEGLEDSIISITSQAVKSALIEGRRDLTEDRKFFNVG